MGEGLQNPDLTLEQLYDQAIQARPELQNYGQNFLQYLQDKYPGQFEGVYFEQGTLKELERIQNKIKGDYDGDYTKVVDIVRGRLLVETPEQIQIIRQEMATLQQNLNIEKIKDFYAEPLLTHFRTLNSQVRLPNGHVGEFRVDQIDMATAGDQTHALYEEMQAIERLVKLENRSFTEVESEQWERLLDEQRVEFDRASSKANLDSLLTEKGAASLEIHRNTRMAALADTFGKLGKNGGVIAGVALGTLSGAFTLAAGGSKAEAAQAVYESAVPYGETQFALAHGDFAAAERSATIETVSNTGAAGGALAGAAIGTVILPGIGTAIGAIVGGVGVGVGAGYVTEKIYDNYAVIKGSAVHVAQETAENLNRAVQNSKALLVSWFDKSPALDVQVALKALPDFATPDMPPEVAALVEVKASPELFEKRFAEIKEHGGLPEVVAYIESHPEHEKQKSPDAQDQSLNYAHSFSPGFA